MTTHLISCVRVALLLGLSLMSMPLLRNAPATARRLVLSTVFVFVLALPFVPAWHFDSPAAQPLIGRLVSEPLLSSAVARSEVAASSSSPVDATDWLAVVYVVGALIVFLRFVIGVILANRIAKRSFPLAESTDAEGCRAIAAVTDRLGRPVDVRISRDIGAPAVTGTFAPVVLVPASSRTWSEARWTSVLLHELAHIAAFDLAVQALASIACSLHWFNPLAWAAMRRLRLERELAADEAVLRAGTTASSYAEHLLAIAGASHRGMIAIAEHPMQKRIAAIVAARRPAVLGAKSAVGLVAAAAAVSFGVACTTTTAEAAPPHAAPSIVEHDLQAVAEDELGRAMKQWNAPAGTILVLSPNGDVLANAGGRSERAYVAGSTMKPILLAAALDEGVVERDDVFDCSVGRRGSKTLSDWQSNGRLTLQKMLAVSTNIGFAQVFDRLGGARADRALRRFHFTPPAGFARQPAGDWDGALTAIGITMTTTPLEVASAYAAIANGGNGIVKASTAEHIARLLEGVVTSEMGTGKKARVDGVRVAGKTGSSYWTAQSGVETGYASFVGFVPADHPRYVIFVGLEGTAKQTSGGEAAAPVFSRVAARALRR